MSVKGYHRDDPGPQCNIKLCFTYMRACHYFVCFSVMSEMDCFSNITGKKCADEYNGLLIDLY